MNFALIFIDRCIVSLATFLTMMVTARLLTPYVFGEFSLCINLLVVVGGVQNSLILGPMRVHGVGLNPVNSSQYFGAQLYLQNYLGIFAAFLTTLASVLLINKTSISFILIVLLTTYLYQISEFSRVVQITKCNNKSLLLNDLIVTGGRFLLITLTALAYCADLNPMISAIGLAYGLGAGFWILSFNYDKAISHNSVRPIAKRNLNYGKWMLYETICYLMSTQAYLYITAAYLGPANAGVLAALNSLAGAFNVVIISVSSHAIPASRKKLLEGDYDGWRKILILSGSGLIILSIFVIILFSAFPFILLDLAFGKNIAPFAYLLPLATFASLLQSVNTIFSVAFQTTEIPRNGFIAKLASSIISILCIFPLIYTFGVQGALIGQILTQIVWLIVFIIFLCARQLSHASVMTRVNKACTATHLLT